MGGDGDDRPGDAEREQDADRADRLDEPDRERDAEQADHDCATRVHRRIIGTASAPTRFPRNALGFEQFCSLWA
jgi:hypothetical protein